MSFYDIPIVSIDKLVKNGRCNEREKMEYRMVGTELAKAFKNIGFVYLKDHGISEYLIKEAHENSTKFFNLPNHVKEKYSKDEASLEEEGNHGYVSMNREKLAMGLAPSEIRESYDINCLNGKFPLEELSDLKSKVTELCEESLELCFRIITALELALDLEPDTLLQHHSQSLPNTGSLMRLLHYPPIPADVEEGAVRCGTHSDYGTITLLFQDQMGGLEVLNRHGEWKSATPIKNTILVNVGDLLQIWTSDEFVATKHRVLIPEEEAKKRCSRSSIVLFYHPLNNALVQPLDNSFKYKPITAGQYLINKYNSTYEY